jgi:hypothetical protein
MVQEPTLHVGADIFECLVSEQGRDQRVECLGQIRVAGRFPQCSMELEVQRRRVHLATLSPRLHACHDVSESRRVFLADLEPTELEGLGFQHYAQAVDALHVFFAQ